VQRVRRVWEAAIRPWQWRLWAFVIINFVIMIVYFQLTDNFPHGDHHRHRNDDGENYENNCPERNLIIPFLRSLG
jgi:hypothetical protein